MDTSKLVSLGILAGVLYAAWRYGGAEGKGAALGVAGFVLVNQIPMVRDGLQARLVA